MTNSRSAAPRARRRPPRAVIAVAAALSALSPLSPGQFSGGRVVVVDAQLGPGADFADLPEAAAAARDGDLLLVRTGRYSGFHVDGKGLRVCADAGAQVEVAGIISVDDLGGIEEFLLRGLASPPNPPYFEFDGLASIGPIWLEDCRLGVPVGGAGNYGRPAVYLKSITSIAFLRCDLGGGAGLTLPFEALDAAPGITADFSNLWLYDTVVRGGDAGPGAGAAGARGIDLTNFELFASGCTLVGGDGADGGACGEGGDGGDGIGALGLVSNLHLHANAYQPGSGGLGGPCATATRDGADGARVSTSGGLSENLVGPSRGYAVSTPIRAGDSIVLDFTAPAGELVATYASLYMDTVQAYQLSGLLLTEPPLTPLWIGVVPPGGQVSTGHTQNLVPPGFGYLALFTQSLFAPGGGEPRVLGPASALIVLAP